MTVYVDDLRQFPTTIRCFRPGSCHLTADSPDELHAMALKIGLRREWFQDHQLAPHYDLTKTRREAALAAGAIYKSAREQAVERRERRALCRVETCRAVSSRLEHAICPTCRWASPTPLA